MFYLFFYMFFLQLALGQDLYQTRSGKVSFYSSAPIENIEAFSDSGISVLNPENGEIVFKIKIRSFDFKKDLMQEHFNENYMESHKYPFGIFTGHIQPLPNPDLLDPQKVVIKGNLEIHGTVQSREIPAEIRFLNNSFFLETNFEILCKDHGIKIPRLMFRNIAEVIKVSLDIHFKPHIP